MFVFPFTPVSAAVAGSGAGVATVRDLDMMAAVLAAGPVVKGVMLVLLAFSILSWAIIIGKGCQLWRARRENREFFRRFYALNDPKAAVQATGDLPASPAARLFQQVVTAPAAPVNHGSSPLTPPGWRSSRDQVVRARLLREALTREGESLRRFLSFLATCGNTAPFIGLFGTVWGIMSSFHQIGLKGSASLATVAPGIAEALIATAAGLAAAIPAVVAYNYFLAQVQHLETELADFAGDLAAIVDRGAEAESG